jgi:hypothetical protein
MSSSSQLCPFLMREHCNNHDCAVMRLVISRVVFCLQFMNILMPYPEDGCSILLRNADNYPRDYTASLARKSLSQYSPPPDINHIISVFTATRHKPRNHSNYKPGRRFVKHSLNQSPTKILVLNQLHVSQIHVVLILKYKSKLCATDI